LCVFKYIYQCESIAVLLYRLPAALYLNTEDINEKTKIKPWFQNSYTTSGKRCINNGKIE
jgi:hypothetical protein